MCDIWKDLGIREISMRQLERHLSSLKDLKVQWVVFSGGEPLLHSNIFALAALLRSVGIRVTLLSSGQLLSDFATQLAEHTDDTILSLDGPEPVHDVIRRVKGAFRSLVRGIEEVRGRRASYPFSCRTTVQRENYRHLRETLRAAKSMGVESISFLAADVTSTAFNRPNPWSQTKQRSIVIPEDGISAFEEEVENLIQEHAPDIESGFLRESPSKLRRLVLHARAQHNQLQPVAPRCNAPWISAVVEADGTVRPCFFHRSIGNVHDHSLADILNSQEALRFREQLDIQSDPICQRCVCSLYLEGRMLPMSAGPGTEPAIAAARSRQG